MAPDPLPEIIADLLHLPGMHPDTRRLIEMARLAQSGQGLTPVEICTELNALPNVTALPDETPTRAL